MAEQHGELKLAVDELRVAFRTLKEELNALAVELEELGGRREGRRVTGQTISNLHVERSQGVEIAAETVQNLVLDRSQMCGPNRIGQIGNISLDHGSRVATDRIEHISGGIVGRALIETGRVDRISGERDGDRPGGTGGEPERGPAGNSHPHPKKRGHRVGRQVSGTGGVEDWYDELEQRIDDMGSFQHDLEARIDDLESMIDDNACQVADLESLLDDSSSRDDELEGRLDEQEDRIGDLESRSEEIRELCERLEEHLDG